jgi:hypothetical protein
MTGPWHFVRSALHGLWYSVLTVRAYIIPHFLAENCDSHEVSADGCCRFREPDRFDGRAGG